MIRSISADAAQRTRASTLALAILAAGVFAYGVDAEAPHLALEFPDGSLEVVEGPETGAAPMVFRVRGVEGRIESTGPLRFRAEITNRATWVLPCVWFPYDARPQAIGARSNDDVVYYPYRFGVAERADASKDAWWGIEYPGPAFAPLVVMADPRGARIAAAANWPPRSVHPSFRKFRLGIAYREPLAPGQTQTYEALAGTVDADPERGEVAWCKAIDAYQAWLNPLREANGLSPVNYPDALRAAHGWMAVYLHTEARFSAEKLRRHYARYRSEIPWVQFWGQMSNFQVSPGDGQVGQPVPPLAPGEETGCCVEIPGIHPRYSDELARFARDVVSSGGTCGYYSRPKSPYRPLRGAELEALQSWVRANQAAGANAFYLDVIGGVHMGPALDVARAIRDDFPPMTVIEFAVDVYPAAFLLSGSLWGGFEWQTNAGETLADKPRVTFPAFGRRIIDDRIVFLGVANGDFATWGDVRGYKCWTERQAFLLGAKFDCPTWFKGVREWMPPLSPAARAAVGERERVGWWRRELRYRDREGITSFPAGVDVRRFVEGNGDNWFVVDNWTAQRAGSFRFKEQTAAFGPAGLSIVGPLH